MKRIGSKNITLSFAANRVDVGRRLVYGAVYSPGVMDAKGYFMEPEEVQKMAHKFMRLDMSKVIDTNHDNVPNHCRPIESYIAKDNDPDYLPGTWVLGIHVPNDDIWNRINEGDLNAFSMEILVEREPVTVEFESQPIVFGQTEDAPDGHSHTFVASIDELGNIIEGKTSETNGHIHEITIHSITNQTNKHHHRFVIHS